MCFGLGKVVKSGSTPNCTYTCTPLIPSNGDATELASFSFVEQIRPGSGVVLDRMEVGFAVEAWTIMVAPVRAGQQHDLRRIPWLGQAHGTLRDHGARGDRREAPAVRVAGPHDQRRRLCVEQEHRVPRNVLEEQHQNGCWFPGSGFQTPGDATTGAVRGRLEFGDRRGTLKFTARFDNDSTELTKLKAQTTGTATILLQFDANDSLSITWQKVSFATAEVGETDQFVTVAVECTPIYDATNGLITAVAKCNVDGICQWRGSTMETQVFDASRPIAINLRTPGGVKTVRVRFPSEDEWISRQRRRKVLVKQLGRGISETTVANGEDVDAALVATIRDGEEPEIDPFEARKVIEQLSLAEVDDVVPDGDSFKVPLRVLGATTVHLLKMPSAKDVFEYRRGFARLLDMPFGRQEVTINIGSAAALYKKLITSTEGYVGEAPIIHQAVALKAAIDAMDTAFAEDRDANF